MMTILLFELFFEQIFIDSRGNSYIMLAHNIFCFISSLILFSIGMRIKRMITESLNDSFKTNSVNKEDNSNCNDLNKNEIINEKENYQVKNIDAINLNDSHTNLLNATSNCNNEDYKNLMAESIDMITPNCNGEIYFNVRYKQINIVTFSFLICDTYELFYGIGKRFFLKEYFKMDKFDTIPLNEEAAFIFFMYLFCVIMPIITNFFAFYYVIRKSYDHPVIRRMSTCNFSENDIKHYASMKTQDIEQFLN